MKANQSDIRPDVPLPIPSGLICFWKKTRATIPSGWGLCDGLWYDPRDMTPGQVGQAATDANHTVHTDNLLNKFIAGAGDLYAQGATGGSATHILSEAELAAHDHEATGLTASITPGGTHLHSTNIYPPGVDPPGVGADGYTAGDGNRDSTTTIKTPVTGSHDHPITMQGYTAQTGDGHEHNNMPPYCAEYPIEKL